MSFQDYIKELTSKVDFRKECEINGIKFELGMLNLREEQIINSLDSDTSDGLNFFNESRKLLLAHAIKKIDGQIVPNIVDILDKNGDKSTKEKAVYLREFLESLPTFFLDQLFEAYFDLREESEKNLKDKVKYDWFKSPEERKKEQEEKAKKPDGGKVPEKDTDSEEPPIILKKLEESSKE